MQTDVVEVGFNRGLGCIVGVQPWLDSRDYQAFDSFDATVTEAISSAGRLDETCLIVLPEYLGFFLYLAEEPESVFAAGSAEGAYRLAIMRRPWLLVEANPAKPGFLRRTIKAWVHERGPEVVRSYGRLVRDWARRFDTTVVGGSILAPEPTLQGGELFPARRLEADLINVCPIAAPWGLSAIATKLNPTRREHDRLGVSRGEGPMAIQTDMGNIGVMICADSWYPESFLEVARYDPKAVVCPAFLPLDGGWDSIWQGYDAPEGSSAPSDVSPSDPGHLTEREAWLRYTSPGRLWLSGASHALTVFLRGRLWDLVGAGEAIAVHENQTTTLPAIDGRHHVVRLWL